MGTRNLTMVKADNEYKIGQYGQYDGHPDVQGVEILTALLLMDGFSSFKEKVNSLKQLTDIEAQEYLKSCGGDDSGWVSLAVSKVFEEKYPHLHRNFAGQIIAAVASGDVTEVLIDISFAGDSLFCEWAYVVDLDANTFEVYCGFNKTPLKKNDRFYSLQKKGSVYYPVRKLIGWSLDALPDIDDFLNQCTFATAVLKESE